MEGFTQVASTVCNSTKKHTCPQPCCCPRSTLPFPCPARATCSRTGSRAMNVLQRSCSCTASKIALSEKSVKVNQMDVIFSVLLLPSACSRFASNFSSRQSYTILAVRYIKGYMPLVNQFCSASSFRPAGFLIHCTSCSHSSSLTSNAALQRPEEHQTETLQCFVFFSP